MSSRPKKAPLVGNPAKAPYKPWPALWSLVVGFFMILVDGISVIGAAMDMNRDRIPGRAWLWIIGLLEALLGVAGFLKPEILSITLGILLGISLIYEGLVLGYTCFMAMKWRRLMYQ